MKGPCLGVTNHGIEAMLTDQVVQIIVPLIIAVALAEVVFLVVSDALTAGSQSQSSEPDTGAPGKAVHEPNNLTSIEPAEEALGTRSSGTTAGVAIVVVALGIGALVFLLVFHSVGESVRRALPTSCFFC